MDKDFLLVLIGGGIAIVSALATSLLNHWLAISIEREKEDRIFLNNTYKEVEQYLLDLTAAITKLNTSIADNPTISKEGLLQEFVNKATNINKFYAVSVFENDLLLEQLEKFFEVVRKIPIQYIDNPELAKIHENEIIKAIRDATEQSVIVQKQLLELRKNGYKRKKQFSLPRFLKSPTKR